jgi:NAD(P)-dependent dehydrogenase (short-subunit alcohol dehydrogenase family)
LPKSNRKERKEAQRTEKDPTNPEIRFPSSTSKVLPFTEDPMSDPVLAARPILERFRLDGRVALVTGAAQGIGRAFAHALGEAGASVAVVDLRVDLAEEVAHELAAKEIAALPVTADVTRPEAVQAMVERVVGHWGSLTIAVNNAGIGMWADAEQMAYADWLRVLDVDLNSVFLCAQAEAQVMLPAGYGKIINTASMSGHISNTPQNQSAYNTAKAGVLHLTRSLAAEWAKRGVRVNSISPGYTRTKLVDDLLATPIGQTMLPVWMGMTPMGRMAEVTDLQGAVVYLASAASDYMTGHDMVIDGGYCAW